MDAMLAATATAENRHFWFKGLRRAARQVLDGELGERRLNQILDCGCGTGRNLDWLKAYGAAVGVELSPTGLAAARAHGRPVIQGSVTHLPIANASVDLATSFDVLYCLPDDAERQALAEMARVLRPRGLALFNFAALDILHGSHSALTMEVRRYTKARVRERLDAAGFDIARLTFTNFATFPLTLAVRWSDRMRGAAATASTSDLEVPASPVNAALDLALRAEALALRVVDLPVGSSLLCLARKR
jgi:SAM-dependent methyltransferase